VRRRTQAGPGDVEEETQLARNRTATPVLRQTPIVSLIAVVGWVLVVASSIAQGQEFLPGVVVGTVESAAVNEASGLAASRDNAGVLWAHNDSGDSARAFAMDTAGNHLGIYNILGASAYDWEDMAIGPGPVAGDDYLYLGDIGDNNAVRSSIKVYRVPEPLVDPGQDPMNVDLGGAETITLLYPDGARDAETLMIDPLNGDIYVVSKRESRSRVYRAAYPQSTIDPITMDYLGQLPWGWATGGDISPDGDEIIVRGYWSGSLWTRGPGQSIWDALAGSPVSVPIASEPQGEAIGFDSAGEGYFTVSENTHQPIYYYQRIGPGDFDSDGDVDADDVDLLCANIGTTDPGLLAMMDLDGDLDVDTDDQILHITTLLEYDLDGDDVADGQGTFQADFNTDGVVDLADLTILRGNSGLTGKGFADGDTNCDGTVDLADLTTLRGLSGSSVSGVPEPAFASWFALGGASLLRRRRRR